MIITKETFSLPPLVFQVQFGNTGQRKGESREFSSLTLGFSKFAVLKVSEFIGWYGTLISHILLEKKWHKFEVTQCLTMTKHWLRVKFKGEVIEKAHILTQDSLYFLMVKYQVNLAFLYEDIRELLSLRPCVPWGQGLCSWASQHPRNAFRAQEGMNKTSQRTESGNFHIRILSLNSFSWGRDSGQLSDGE